MKKLIYSVSVLLVLSACNSGGGGGNASGGGDSEPVPTEQDFKDAASVKDYATTIAPYAFTVTKANLSVNDEKERFALGCATAGQQSYKGMIDPRLTAGDLFRTQTGEGHALKKDLVQTTAKTAAVVDSEKLVFETNYEFLDLTGTPFTSIDQIYSARPHMTVTEKLATDENGNLQSSYDFNINLTPEGASFFASAPSSKSFSSCTIASDSGQFFASAMDKISYNFNGRPVVAYAEKISQNGDVVCERRSLDKNELIYSYKLGTGHRETKTIYSNEVVADGFATCGGREIYRMARLVLDSGKVIESTAEKVLSAPLR